jgi:hypothetical protein
MEPKETAVGRQVFGKHVPASTSNHATIAELLEPVFYTASVVSGTQYVVKEAGRLI